MNKKNIIIFVIGILVFLSIGVLIGCAYGKQQNTLLNNIFVPFDDHKLSESDVDFYNNIGVFSSFGSWLPISGDSYQFGDVNSVDIKCFFEEKYCHVAIAELKYEGDIFVNEIFFYDITSWDDDGNILAVNKQDQCVDRTLNMDIKSNIIILTKSRKDGVTESLCGSEIESAVFQLGEFGNLSSK